MNSSKVYLVQTDTTVGFLSSNDKKLNSIKDRPSEQKILQIVSDFKILKQHTRVPNIYKNRVRRSQKTTYIYSNNNAFRVLVHKNKHYDFLNKFNILYSTSANKTNEEFCEKYSIEKSDIVLYTKNIFHENSASKIYKLSSSKIKKIR